MLSEAAFVKLGCVLGRLREEKKKAGKGEKISREEVEKLMLENWAGEFNDRLGEEF
jgi:hypothetical protein